MEKLKQWYQENYLQLTWFIIGWLSLDLLWCFGKGDYVGMLISGILIALNYSLQKR